MPDDLFKTSPHTPAHLFRADAIYMITGSIYQGRPLIGTASRKSEWRAAFGRASETYAWQIIAWVVLNNHYHALVRSPSEKPIDMSRYVGSFHKYTARRWNDHDRTPGRRVWWNYWDRCVRSDLDFQARLRYILLNPVKHGLAGAPEDYRFSNYEECLRNWEIGWGSLNDIEVRDVPEF
jgi:REP-associated tyrosine transposase